MRGGKSIIKIASISILGIIIVSYSIFQAWKIIQGPIINVYSPQNGQTFNQSLIEVEGTVKNVSHINLNDRPIFTDKNGYFKEKFLLSPGYNVIKLDASDKFKKNTEKRLTVILKEY
jgi:hypothetical protein